MNSIATFLLLAFFLPLPLIAQRPGEYPCTMYVTFDRALVYAEADYASEVIDTLRLRDSVAVLGNQGKYFRVSLGGKPGYVLWANLGMTRAKGKGVKKSASTDRRASDTANRRKSDTMPGRLEGNRDTASIQDSSAVQVTEKPTVKREPKSISSESKLPQCRAITKAGKQCSRRASDSSDYCWQHKEKH